MEIFEVLLTFLGAISLPLVTFIIFWFKRKNKVVEDENQFLKDNIYVSKVNILKEIFDLHSFYELDKQLEGRLSNTPFDRFSIMILMNGKVHFKYMTLLFDKKKSHSDMSFTLPYRKIRIDERYHNLIINLNVGFSEWLCNGLERAGNIKGMLEEENIKCIGYYKVKRVPLDEFNDLFVYCCWSTENDKKPSEKDIRDIDIITNGEIIPIINDIIKAPSVYDSDRLFEHIRTN